MTEIFSRTERLKTGLKRPVVLIGMMGVGKSYLGQQLARSLDLPFYDTDKLIEDKAGCSVSEIFARFGEEKFRQSEKSTILDLLEQGPGIIATGGGAITTPAVLEAILSTAHSIWLKADPASILERIQERPTRPLLQTQNPKETLLSLLDRRTPLYAQADITVDTDTHPAQQTIETLINSLYEAVIPDRV